MLAPDPVPPRDDDSSAQSFYEGHDLEALSVLNRYRAWIMEGFEPYLHGAAVEIGAGIGSYSAQILERVASLDAVEPTAELSQRIEAKFSHDNRVRTFNKTVEGWIQATAPEIYDAVIMINVLEHIADDRAVLAALHERLRPGGHLLLFVPALPRLYSRIDRLLGHHRRYTLPDLREKTLAAGFSIKVARYFDMLGTIPWFLINTLAGATRFSPGAARLYDALGVPVTRAVERWISPPFAKNILLVGRRDD